MSDSIEQSLLSAEEVKHIQYGRHVTPFIGEGSSSIYWTIGDTYLLLESNNMHIKVTGDNLLKLRDILTCIDPKAGVNMDQSVAKDFFGYKRQHTING